MISIADGIGLLIGIVLIAIVADRLRIAYPILLVVAGIGVALLPLKHRIELQPDLVLLVFLPPLIYDASLDTSARELRAQWRPILLLAVVGELDRQLSEAWAAAIEGIDDPLERLVAALDAAADRCARHPELWRALLDVSMLSLSNPALQTRCQELRSRFTAGIEAEVRRALGRLPAYSLVAPRDLAGAIAAALEGAAVAALVGSRDTTSSVQALKVMVLAVVVTAHVIAGQEPPIARLAQLVRPR